MLSLKEYLVLNETRLNVYCCMASFIVKQDTQLLHFFVLEESIYILYTIQCCDDTYIEKWENDVLIEYIWMCRFIVYKSSIKPVHSLFHFASGL